jgi:hypothetical protein
MTFNCSTLNFLDYEENFLFFFIRVHVNFCVSVIKLKCHFFIFRWLNLTNSFYSEHLLLGTGVHVYIKYMLAFSRLLTILFYHYVRVSVVLCGQQCASSEKVYNYCKKTVRFFPIFFQSSSYYWDLW